jgi:hypothetical protein
MDSLREATPEEHGKEVDQIIGQIKDVFLILFAVSPEIVVLVSWLISKLHSTNRDFPALIQP